MEQLLFYVVCTLSLLSATCVVVVKNPIQSVLSLIVTFFLTAFLWLILKAEFLAVLLIIVYVGAVMVLFLFAVMLLDIKDYLLDRKFINNTIFFIVISSVLLFTFLFVVQKDSSFFTPLCETTVTTDISINNTKELGFLLYSNYIFEFEVAGVLLLIGIISAIALIYRGKQSRKNQNVTEQIETKNSDRINFINKEFE
jgi:NADH-quinone oxidoreductase subunit J